ncbi:MAG TPA: tetratricopeptide repeat protein [Micropepsaceae bacterium]|nr:tetratricopeptide repeat protein [Micropepsaceae bacterium]
MSEVVLQNALALRRAGKFAEAAQIYGDILRAEPKNFEALHALGILRYQCGELEQAERLIGEAVTVNPRAADALYNRGSLLLKLKRFEEALSCFGQALAIKPDYAEALGNRGAVLMELGRYAEALMDFDRLTSLKPGLAEAWSNQGGARHKLRRYEQAYASFGKALALRPNYPDARKSRGAAAFALKRFADALADADQALTFDSRNADSWEQRADALAELNRREEAVVSYDRLLELRPGSIDALHNRANNLMILRRFEEAARDYAEALRLRPDCRYAAGNLAFARLCTCDWRDYGVDGERVRSGLREKRLVSPPFQALVLSENPADAYQAARLWAEQAGTFSSEPLWRGEVYRHDKIRVAYLSANFQDHAVARLMAGVPEHHDRQRFETYAFSFGPDDAGPLRARLRNAFDHFVDVRDLTEEQIARGLREVEADIAVDMMGFTQGNRPGILGFRPAPVQVNYLGYPGTSGAEWVDYIIADSFVIPPEQQVHYHEKVVYLPNAYLPGDSKRRISPRVPARSDVGLPDQGFVFCCFNNNYKITPAIFDVWMRLLGAVKGSVLWLSYPNASTIQNLKREAESRGISPERLVFSSYIKLDEDHLARLSLADLFLDTLPYNAHATASDALWANVPVLTIAGASFPGRVAASLLHAIGMAELVAPSLAAYEARALQLAGNPAELTALKAKLARHRDTQPLFDTARFTRNLERAYEAMWDRSQRGLPPAAFAVEGVP